MQINQKVISAESTDDTDKFDYISSLIDFLTEGPKVQ